KNNGQGFEHKLAQLAIKSPEAAATAATGTSSTATASTSKTNTPTAGVTSGLTNQIQKNVLSQPALEQKLMGQKPVAHIANQDLKGALLSVLHQLDGELETTSPLATSISTSSELSKTQLANVLPQFLGMLMHRQQGELSQKQLR